MHGAKLLSRKNFQEKVYSSKFVLPCKHMHGACTPMHKSVHARSILCQHLHYKVAWCQSQSVNQLNLNSDSRDVSQQFENSTPGSGVRVSLKSLTTQALSFMFLSLCFPCSSWSNWKYCDTLFQILTRIKHQRENQGHKAMSLPWNNFTARYTKLWCLMIQRGHWWCYCCLYWLK